MDKEQPDSANGAGPRNEKLEERRLSLEFERLRLDRQKASIELRLKRRELNVSQKKGLISLLGNPLTLAIVGGFITLMTTTIASHFSASESINAETVKARQALQADLIKKFVDNPSPQTVRANLRFLVDVGLVPDYADSLQAFLNKNPDSALPTSSASGLSVLNGVHTDNDAIDLVMRLAGGYLDFPEDHGGPEKWGITITALSRYLGKPVSKDDLRDLSAEIGREYYRKTFLGGAAGAINSVQAKAAYLSLAALMGPRRAGQLFRGAASKLANITLPSASEGPPALLDAPTVQIINSVDTDTLIETANCEAASVFSRIVAENKSNAVFLPRWMQRLRMFSPVSLKGICPELLPVSVPPDATSTNPVSASAPGTAQK